MQVSQVLSASSVLCEMSQREEHEACGCKFDCAEPCKCLEICTPNIFGTVAPRVGLSLLSAAAFAGILFLVARENVEAGFTILGVGIWLSYANFFLVVGLMLYVFIKQARMIHEVREDDGRNRV